VDTVALSPAATARKVAYVPGQPFYPGQGGATQMRLAYSRVSDELIDEGARRLGDLVRTALEGS
jgi:2-aminoadipate transaminase